MTRRDDEDHESLADQLDKEADQLERRSEELGDEVDQARQDWQGKRADQGVPGAVPPEDETSAEGNDAPPGREAGDAQAEESG
jgi:hypothetical protein